jgi:hypothetical protein
MQEYWDACLIKTWRNNGKLGDVFRMFYSITKTKVDEIDPPLLRIPLTNVPWGIGIRAFMAAHLEKISTRLWDQPPEKDVLLLKKLQTSKYNTSYRDTNIDKELQSERQNLPRRKSRIGIETLATVTRNRSTDWNVVK